jgi:outer membrane protein, multidrug efflux system
MTNRAGFLRIVLLFVTIILFPGCTLHPRYKRPCNEVPEHWRVPFDESSSYVNFAWWEQFQDPVLNCLIAEALANNKDLKVAIARVYEFYGQFLVATSGLYPQINGTFQALRQEVSIALTPFPSEFKRTFNDFNCLLNASYDIDIWGRIRSGSEAAWARLLAQEDARQVVVLTVVSSLATAYIQMLQYDKQREISIRTYESRKKSYELAVARYEGGLTSELEVKQAESLMEGALVQVIEFEILIAQQENLISIIIGHPPQYIARGRNLDSLILPVEVPAGLPSEILEQRPDILRAEQELVAANAQIGVARAQFFPDISLTSYYGNESMDLHNLFTAPARTWLYGASLLQPFFTGGNLIGQLQVATAVEREAYYAYQQTVLNAFREVEDALISHTRTKDLVVVEKRRVEALRDALRLANLQYENGQVDYLNVLDTERFLFAAELDLAFEESKLFLTLVNIYKALGGGWVVEADQQAFEANQDVIEETAL